MVETKEALAPGTVRIAALEAMLVQAGWDEKAVEREIFSCLTHSPDASELTIKSARNLSRYIAQAIVTGTFNNAWQTAVVEQHK